MKLIIDISEEEYQGIVNDAEVLPQSLTHYEKIILNGTILPEGHGRLIETNTIQSMARKKAEDCFPEGRYDYGYRKALFEFVKDIDDAPTIIEADKPESEE